MLSVRARRLIVLLAALTALVLTGCAGVATTSGPTGVGAQNRVWAFNLAAPSIARPIAAESACSRPGSVLSAAGSAVGFCVAAEDVGAADTVFSFSGHGGIGAGDTSTATIPNGTTLNFFSGHGEPISDATGNLIETGHPPTPTETFGPGSQVPNYWLEPPHGLTIRGNPITVSQPTRLSDLLQEGMGNCHWAACRSVG